MNASLLVASSTSIGGRRKQEDRVVTVPDLNVHIPETTQLDRGVARSYFAVFDGHGGAGASSFLAKRFHIALAKNPLLASDPKAALLDVWQSMDGELFTFLAQKRRDITARAIINGGGLVPQEEAPFPRDGSTATVLLLVGNKMFSANCGDSAGILVKKNGSVQEITKNHDTLDMDEFMRIKQLGGLYRNQKLQVPRKWPWCCVAQDVVVGKPRVCGLLVTRSFGDFSCKVDALGGTPGVIVPDCEEVLEMEIEEDWAEVVIASDGVWDVVPPREMPKLMARLEGKTTAYVSLRSLGITGMNAMYGSGMSLKDAPISINGRYQQGGDASTSGSDRDSSTYGEETDRMSQAKLQGACAKLILTCVRDRYWAANLAAADNASAVIVRFRLPTRSPSSSEGGTCPLSEDAAVV